jgi:hypothetical protein
LEGVYQEALELEFQDKNIPYRREASLLITYKGKFLQKEYVADFICFDKIIVELKAVKEIDPIHNSDSYRNRYLIT